MKEVPNGVPVAESGTGAGWPQVKGKCPACGSASLFLGSGGYVTCAIIKCPNPTLVGDLLLQGLHQEQQTCADGSGGVSTNYKTGVTTVSGKPCTRQLRWVSKWENDPSQNAAPYSYEVQP